MPAYLGRTYLTRSQGGSLLLDFVMDRTEETRVHQMELNASGSAKISDVLVVAAGLNDWLGVSGARRPFASARFGIVDTPLQGFYENVGGIELTLKVHGTGDGFGLGLVGLAGDIRISEVLLRGGYQYDGVDSSTNPGLGLVSMMAKSHSIMVR